MSGAKFMAKELKLHKEGQGRSLTHRGVPENCHMQLTSWPKEGSGILGKVPT